MKKSRKENRARPLELTGNQPVIEFTGNRRALIEGSTGILRYEDETVSVNTRCAVVIINGRALRLRCISPTAVIIEGFITSVEFST